MHTHTHTHQMAGCLFDDFPAPVSTWIKYVRQWITSSIRYAATTELWCWRVASSKSSQSYSLQSCASPWAHLCCLRNGSLQSGSYWLRDLETFIQKGLIFYFISIFIHFFPHVFFLQLFLLSVNFLPSYYESKTKTGNKTASKRRWTFYFLFLKFPIVCKLFRNRLFCLI